MFRKIIAIAATFLFSVMLCAPALATETDEPSIVEQNILAHFDLTNPNEQTYTYTDQNGDPVTVGIRKVSDNAGLKVSEDVYAGEWHIWQNFVVVQMDYYISVDSSLNITDAYNPHYVLIGTELTHEDLTFSSTRANYNIGVKGQLFPYASASYNLSCRISGSTLYINE